MSNESFLRLTKYIGIGFIALALLFVWLTWWIPAFVVLTTVGIMDLVLVFRGHETISKWIHRQWPRGIDLAVGIVLVVAAFGFGWLTGFGALPAGVLALMYFIVGHLLWHS